MNLAARLVYSYEYCVCVAHMHTPQCRGVALKDIIYSGPAVRSALNVCMLLIINRPCIISSYK